MSLKSPLEVKMKMVKSLLLIPSVAGMIAYDQTTVGHDRGHGHIDDDGSGLCIGETGG